MLEKNIFVAERCYCAIGDVSKSRYLKKIRESIENLEEEVGKESAQNHFQVKAHLAAANKKQQKEFGSTATGIGGDRSGAGGPRARP